MKIVFQGYSGKIGRVVYDEVRKAGHEIILALDDKCRFDEFTLKKYEIDAIIDFSNKTACRKLMEFAIKYKIPFISGTTGFTYVEKNQFDEEALKAELGIYLVSNFLISISRLRDFLSIIEDYYDKIYIEETHHESKLDSPSGTALFLSEAINQKKLAQITAKRVKIYMYEHEVMLSNDYESLTIAHRVFDKKGYALGVLKALGNVKTFIGLRDHI